MPMYFENITAGGQSVHDSVSGFRVPRGALQASPRRTQATPSVESTSSQVAEQIRLPKVSLPKANAVAGRADHVLRLAHCGFAAEKLTRLYASKAQARRLNR